MATAAEVRNKALRKVRVLEENDTPTTEMASDVDETYLELHAKLFEDNAVYWDSDEEVPTEAVLPIVKLLAAEIADEYGVDEARYQRLQIEAYGIAGTFNTGAYGTLIDLANNNYVSTVTTAEYY